MKYKNKFIILILVLSFLLLSCFNSGSHTSKVNSKLYLPDEIYFDGIEFYFENKATGDVTYSVDCIDSHNTYVEETETIKFLLPIYDLTEDYITFTVTCYDRNGDSSKDYISKDYKIDVLLAPKRNDIKFLDNVISFPPVSKATSYIIKYGDKEYNVNEPKVELEDFKYGEELYIKPVKDGIYAYTTIKTKIYNGNELQYFKYNQKDGYFSWHNQSVIYSNYKLTIIDGDETIEESIKGDWFYRYEPKSDHVTATLELYGKGGYDEYYPGDTKTIEINKIDIDIDVTSFNDSGIFLNDNLDLAKELSYQLIKDDKELAKGDFKTGITLKGGEFNGIYDLVIKQVMTADNYYTKETKSFKLAYYPDFNIKIEDQNNNLVFKFSDTSVLTENLGVYLKVNDTDFILYETYNDITKTKYIEIPFEKDKYFEIKIIRDEVDAIIENNNYHLSKYQFTDLPTATAFKVNENNKYVLEYDITEDKAHYYMYYNDKYLDEGKEGSITIDKKKIPDEEVDIYLVKSSYNSLDVYYPSLKSKLDVKRLDKPEFSFDYRTIKISNDQKMLHHLTKAGNNSWFEAFYNEYEFEQEKSTFGATTYMLKTSSKEDYTLDSLPVTIKINFLHNYSTPKLLGYEFKYTSDYQLKIIINDEIFTPENNTIDLESYYNSTTDINFTYYLEYNKEVTNDLYYLPSDKMTYKLVSAKNDFRISLSNNDGVINFEKYDYYQKYHYNLYDNDDKLMAGVNDVVATKDMTSLKAGKYKLEVVPISCINNTSNVYSISSLTPKYYTFYKNGVYKVTKTGEYKVSYLSDINNLGIFTPGFYIDNVEYQATPNYAKLNDGDYKVIVKDNSDTLVLDQNNIFKFNDYEFTQTIATNEKAYCNTKTIQIDYGEYNMNVRAKPESYIRINITQESAVNIVEYEYKRQTTDNANNNETITGEAEEYLEKEKNYIKVPVKFGRNTDLKLRFKGNILASNGTYYKYNTYRDVSEVFIILPYIHNIKATVTYNSSYTGYSFHMEYKMISTYLMPEDKVTLVDDAIIYINGEKTEFHAQQSHYYNSTGYTSYITYYGKNNVLAQDTVTFYIRFRTLVGNEYRYSPTMVISFTANATGWEYNYTN